MDFWERSEKLAKVIKEHRIVTRVAGFMIIIYCTIQIGESRQIMIDAVHYENAEVAKMIIDNQKWIIGQFVGMLTIAFSVYSGTGNK